MKTKIGLYAIVIRKGGDIRIRATRGKEDLRSDERSAYYTSVGGGLYPSQLEEALYDFNTEIKMLAHGSPERKTCLT